MVHIERNVMQSNLLENKQPTTYISMYALLTYHSRVLNRRRAKAWTSSYWTAKSSLFFLTSDQHEGGTWVPNYTLGVDVLEHDFL